MEEIKKIEVQGQQYGVADMLMRGVMGGNAQVIEWSHTHNMNDYKDAGTYRIKGERTGNPMEDNLPIMNQGSGHTIDGVLYVLDSSLTNGSGKESDCTITQFLMLSNRVGGQEGDMYMRSGYGSNKSSLTWKPWEKYQTNMEVGFVSDEVEHSPTTGEPISNKGMNSLVDSGIYSGIYVSPKAMIGTPSVGSAVIQDVTAIETFVMVVINNYAAASNDRCVTQIKFAVTNGGVFSMEKRSTDLGTTYNWSEWESIGGSGLPDGISINITKENNGFIIESENSTLKLGSGIIEAIGPGVNTLISGNARIGGEAKIGQNVNVGSYVSIGNSVEIARSVIIGEETYIGNSVNIGDKIRVHSLGNKYGISIGTDIDDNDIKIEIDVAASKIIFSCYGKTAELPLT